MPAAVPETSNATSAPAPAVQSSTQRGDVARRRGRRLASPSARRRRGDARSARRRRPRPRGRATRAISRPIGPPPTTTACSPAVSPQRRTSCTATAVGSASAAVCERRGRRASGRARPPARSSATASTRARRSRGRPAGSRCAMRRSARGARCRTRRAASRSTASPAAQPSTPLADGRHAAGHLVAEHGGHASRARPSRRGGCGGRCRRCRCRRPRAAPRRARAAAPPCRPPRAHRCRCSERHSYDEHISVAWTLKDQTNFPSLPSMLRHVESVRRISQTNGGLT